MLHHACEPTHPEPTSQDTLQISIRKFSSHTPLFWTLPEQLGTDYTTHVCQPWTNVAKTHHKTSDPKIFISHIPVLNFAGTALHITPRMCPNPSWRHTTKSQTPRFSSHTSLFWTLPELLSMLHHACEPTHPEPTSQDTLQTSIRKFSSHTSLFRTLPEQLGTDDTTHVCQPILNQRSKDTPQNLRPQDFYLTSLFWTLPDTPQNLRPRFLSHIPVLNFAGAALHVTPRMWANPSCTNVPRYNIND